MTEQEKYQQLLTELRSKKGYICDMDGVIYHGNRLLPGVKEFVSWLYEQRKSFLFLTNASERSPKELQQKLLRLGLEVDESHFYTSAQATAKFIHSQAPGCSAYVIGGPGLVNALYDVGITMNDVNPDYVVVGETNSYNYNMILKAVSLINNGARLLFCKVRERAEPLTEFRKPGGDHGDRAHFREIFPKVRKRPDKLRPVVHAAAKDYLRVQHYARSGKAVKI